MAHPDRQPHGQCNGICLAAVSFLSLSTDITDGIKTWKICTLSTQNDLTLEKMK